MTMVVDGVRNFLQLVNDNWTTIIVCIGLVLSIAKKVNSYRKLTKEQKIEVAWMQIRESVLSWCSDAENKWTIDKQIGSAGQIKRSEVIAKIYSQYPILQLVADQKEVLAKIDSIIDDALDEIDNVVSKVDEELSSKEGE